MALEKLDQATGIITVALAGITATLSVSDAIQWGVAIMDLAPLILIGFLLWRVRMLDKSLQKCQCMHDNILEKLLSEKLGD